ncbi:MAG: universal stress protein [Acidimicrobiia bacterium]
MTTIIVPLDGSLEGELALPHARALAGPDPIILMSAIWRGEPIAPRRYLEERATALAGPPVETHVSLDERPELAIAALAKSQECSLICMATHGRNTLAEAFMGSTAEAVTRTTDDPILLVGPHAAYVPSRGEARNLVVAVDGAVTAEAIVPFAAAFARHHRLHLWTVQSVAPAPYPFVADAGVPSKPHEGAGIDAAVAILAHDEMTADSKLLTAIDPADAIVEFACDLPASMVVMGSHARSGLSRIALGNTAMRVAHSAPCPVLVVRQ